MAFRCGGGCGGGIGIAGSSAKITLNGETVVVPYREIKDDDAEPGNQSKKKHIVWNLDNVDVEGHFPQKDFAITQENDEDNYCDTLQKDLQNYDDLTDKQRAKIPKVVRVFRYWTGFDTDNKEVYWKRREARVIEIRHKDCCWYLVVDGVPTRYSKHKAKVADKALFTIPFVVSEFEAEMKDLEDLEQAERKKAAGEEGEGPQQLNGKRLNGMCRIRWSAKKEKWSYAVEVNGVPVPAMWSKPVPGIVMSDFHNFYKEESANCPKTAYMPDVLYAEKNLYTKDEIAQCNGEFMLVYTKAKAEAEKKKDKAAAKAPPPSPSGDDGKGVGTDIVMAREVSSDSRGAGYERLPGQLFEYKTVRVWRFTLDQELRGVEVAHKDTMWYILVDGREVVRFNHNKNGYTPKGGGDKLDTCMRDKKMYGQNFTIRRNKNTWDRTNKDDLQEVDASMQMHFDSKKCRWEYLLIVSGQFIPQCGWKGSDHNPRDFCALSVPEVTVETTLALADAGDGPSIGWKNAPWAEYVETNEKEMQDNLKVAPKSGAPKTSCVFNFTTRFRLRTVAVLHTGGKFVITLDGQWLAEKTHGSSLLSNMDHNISFDIDYSMPDGDLDADGVQPTITQTKKATIRMVWRFRHQWKWQYSMTIDGLEVKDTNGDKKPVQIQPTFNAGWAPCGKPLEIVEHVGLQALEDNATKEEGVFEKPKPKNSVLAEELSPQDTSLVFKYEHGFKEGDKIVIDGHIIKEVMEIVSLPAQIKDLGPEPESEEGEPGGRRPSTESNSKGGRVQVQRCAPDCLVAWQVVHYEWTNVTLYDEEKVLKEALSEASSKLDFHSGSVKMYQDSKKALKTLASFLRSMNPETMDKIRFKITGYFGAKADVFETPTDLKFLGLQRALLVKKKLMDYLEELDGDEIARHWKGKIGAEGKQSDETTQNVFGCSIVKCGEDEIAEMRIDQLQTIQDEEANNLPSYMEVVGDEDGKLFSNEIVSGGEGINPLQHVMASLMTLTNPLQHFIYEAAKDEEPVERLGAGRSSATMEANVSERPKVSNAHWIQSTLASAKDAGNAALGSALMPSKTMRSQQTTDGMPPLPDSKSTQSVLTTGTRATENKDIGVLHVPKSCAVHSLMHASPYGYELHQAVEFFSKTHKRWVAASVTNVVLSCEECFYNIVFASNRMKRQYVAMDSLRPPLCENDTVEVYSKKSDLGWIIGVITQGGSGATSVGYTVQTDKGTFSKVPPERFRRRFKGGQDVQYYVDNKTGWVDAQVWGSQGTDENQNKEGLMISSTASDEIIGPRELQWLGSNQYLDEKQLAPVVNSTGKDMRKPNADIEFSLGDAVTGKANKSAMSTQSKDTTDTGVMAPVGETPLPSGMPLSASPSPSANVAKPEAGAGPKPDDLVDLLTGQCQKHCKITAIFEGGAIQVEVPNLGKPGKSLLRVEAKMWKPTEASSIIEPWTKVPIAEEDPEGKKHFMVELWRVRAKPPEKLTIEDKAREQQEAVYDDAPRLPIQGPEDAEDNKIPAAIEDQAQAEDNALEDAFKE